MAGICDGRIEERNDGMAKRKQTGAQAGTDGRRQSTRRPSKTTMTATLFALSTVATLLALVAVAMLACPVPVGIRLLPGMRIPDAVPNGDATGVPALVASLVLLYASSRLTRNATLESDRVKSPALRKLWIALFEIMWVALFVLVGESLAICIDAHLDAPIGGMASWGALLATALARCLFARHDHHARHVACEALRSVGRSGVTCIVWGATVTLLLPYGITESSALWGTVAGVSLTAAALVASLCLAEGRHRDGHGH